MIFCKYVFGRNEEARVGEAIVHCVKRPPVCMKVDEFTGNNHHLNVKSLVISSVVECSSIVCMYESG